MQIFAPAVIVPSIAVCSQRVTSDAFNLGCGFAKRYQMAELFGTRFQRHSRYLFGKLPSVQKFNQYSHGRKRNHDVSRIEQSVCLQ